MTPELSSKLAKVPEIQELIAYLQEERNELNTLANINMDEPRRFPVAIEILARQLALKKIDKILSPLVDIQTVSMPGFSRKEYEV